MTSAAVKVEWQKGWLNLSSHTIEWTSWQPLLTNLSLRELDKFRIRWNGPESSSLQVEGLAPVVSGHPVEWVDSGPLWLPGTYRIVVELDGLEIWAHRIEVSSQKPSFQSFAPRMIEDLESWVPHITRETDRGIRAHAIPSQGSNSDLQLISDALRSIERILQTSEGEFVWQENHPVVTTNTRDHRAMLRALNWLRHFVAARIRVLESVPHDDIHFPHNHLIELIKLRQRIVKVQHHPFWDSVDSPSMSDHLTQRGERRRHFRRVALSLVALRRTLVSSSSSKPELTYMRPTPEIFELWVLLHIIQCLEGLGWSLVQRPVWMNMQHSYGIVDPIPLKSSRFVFSRGSDSLTLDYDRVLPDHVPLDTDTGGIWMSGQHNRPDILLRYDRHDSPSPTVVIIEAKYRPRQRVWPDGNPALTNHNKGQLQQYWSGLMFDKRTHLDPPVICVIPEHEEVVWRTAPTPDVEFITMNPSQSAATWKDHLLSRLDVPGGIKELT